MSVPALARLAVNPIAYWLTDGTPDRSTARLGRTFTELAEIGYQAVKADVPYDMAVDDYLPWLEGFGLAPALSLYSGPFADRNTHGEMADAAGAFAAVQAGLGQRVCLISTVEPPGSARMQHPAVGIEFDPNRLSSIVDGIAASCRAMQSVGVQSVGVQSALHPHVGLGGDRRRGPGRARRYWSGAAGLRPGYWSYVLGWDRCRGNDG